jgi:hypothetical protein
MAPALCPRQSGGTCQVSRRPPRPHLTVLMTKHRHPRQRPRHQEPLTNFQVGLWMTCPKRLEMPNTTCPQRLSQSKPMKVVLVQDDSKQSRLCSLKNLNFY